MNHHLADLGAPLHGHRPPSRSLDLALNFSFYSRFKRFNIVRICIHCGNHLPLQQKFLISSKFVSVCQQWFHILVVQPEAVFVKLHKNNALMKRMSLHPNAKLRVIRTQVTESLGCTIALIQRTKASHCLTQIWGTAKMSSIWKVWMAFFIQSKHSERQTVFRWTLIPCQLQKYCRGSLFSSQQKGKKVLFCLPTPLAGCKQTLI